MIHCRARTASRKPGGIRQQLCLYRKVALATGGSHRAGTGIPDRVGKRGTACLATRDSAKSRTVVRNLKNTVPTVLHPMPAGLPDPNAPEITVAHCLAVLAGLPAARQWDIAGQIDIFGFID